MAEAMPSVCEIRTGELKEFVRAEINSLERRLEEKYGRAKERDQGLEGAIKSLETLVRSEFSAGRQRMERIEERLKGHSEERKALEERVRKIEKEIPDKLEPRLRCVEKKQSLHWGWHLGLAAGVSAAVTMLIIVLHYLKVFPP